MSKRARSSSSSYSLTGGTMDVNPQLFKIDPIIAGAIVNSGNSADNQASRVITLPIASFQQPANGRAVVMEILKVYFTPTPRQTVASTGIVFFRYRMFLVTGNLTNGATINTLSETGMAGQSVFAWTEAQWEKSTGVGGYVTSYNGDINNRELDLTDGQGHGLLIASPQITLALDLFVDNLTSANSLGFAAASQWGCSLLYRFKEVSLSEYIGIQQSQTVQSS